MPKITTLFLLFSFSARLAFAAIPQVGTVTPASSNSFVGVPLNFTVTYSDTDGWQNLKACYFLVNTTTRFQVPSSKFQDVLHNQ